MYLEETEELYNLQKFNVADVTVSYYQLSSYFQHGARNCIEDRLVDGGDIVLRADVNRNFDEKRPSVINNDIVIIWEVDTEDKEFECRVVSVKQRELILIVSHEIKKYYPSNLPQFNMRFTSPRIQWRSLHRAVDHGELSILNPMEEYQYGECPKVKVSMNNLLFEDKSLSIQQKKIVSDVVNFQYKGSPYLIVGPFGSGKTTTLVESIIQIVKNIENARILVVTLTNSAANVLLDKLVEKHFSPDELYRCCSTYYKQFVNRAYTSYNFVTEIYDMLPLAELMSKKIIISTCQLASTLYGLGVKDFSHIIIDEAGQISLMEAMIPLCMVQKKNDKTGKLISVDTNIILAGDHHQLGPIIHNKSAKTLGFGDSPIENLFKNKGWYRNPNTTDKYMTKLTIQYRCCQQIGEFPLERYYKDYNRRHEDKEYKCCFTYQNDLQKERITPYPDFNRSLGLYSKFYPLMFCDLRSEVITIPEVPGIINPIEACFVVDFVSKFIQRSGCAPDEVAIICEQFSQMLCIRQTLLKVKRLNIFVASVTAFQGKEFKYTFICTGSARTIQGELNGDAKKGFWTPINSIDRKLNTAITRASELIMIIGDRTSIGLDEEWSALINFCRQKNSFVEYTQQVDTSFFVNPHVKSNLGNDNQYVPYSYQSQIQSIAIDSKEQFPDLNGTKRNNGSSMPKLDYAKAIKQSNSVISPQRVSPNTQVKENSQFPALVNPQTSPEVPQNTSVWGRDRNVVRVSKVPNGATINISSIANNKTSGEEISNSNSNSPPQRNNQKKLGSGNIVCGENREGFPIKGITINSSINMTWNYIFRDELNQKVEIVFTSSANGFTFKSVEKVVNIDSCTTFKCIATNSTDETLYPFFFHLDVLSFVRYSTKGREVKLFLKYN